MTNEHADTQPPRIDIQTTQNSDPTAAISPPDDDPPAAIPPDQPRPIPAYKRTNEATMATESSPQTTTTSDKQTLTQTHANTGSVDDLKSRQVGKYSLRN
jgi:hypothetical protein